MDPGDRSRRFIEPQRERVSTWNGTDVFLREYSSVPEPVRHLLVAQLCDAEVCNGGFYQFFTNSTGVLAPEAATAFAVVGLPGLSGVVRRAMAVFGEHYPRDCEARTVVLDSYSGNHPDASDPFDALDDEFYTLRREESGGWETAADSYAGSHGG